MLVDPAVFTKLSKADHSYNLLLFELMRLQNTAATLTAAAAPPNLEIFAALKLGVPR